MSSTAFEEIQSATPEYGQPLVRFHYECPECGVKGSLVGEPIGVECRVFCEVCERAPDVDSLVGGIHDVLDTYVLVESEELNLRHVPASRITVLDEAAIAELPSSLVA